MHFRWQWVVVASVCLVMLWILSVVSPACSFGSVMRFGGVRHELAFTMLAVLALACLGLVAVLRVLRKRDDED